ncbi:MAG TPA: DNA primase [Desulfobacterales bacterium]|nr:DNA primase [Desulfobacterales bacterium]
MQYSEEIIQTVKDAADIVEIVGETVNLKKNGTNYKGLCPFHSEKTPSFNVNPNRNFFHCFGCGAGGDTLKFVMLSQNLNFVEALKYLANRYHISLPERDLSPRELEQAKRKNILYDINQQAAAVYHQLLLQDPRAVKAREYLSGRGIGDDIVREFELGYAPEGWNFIRQALPGFSEDDLLAAGLLAVSEKGRVYDRFRDRLLSPIFNHNGKHLAFSGRIIGAGEPKYLNSKDSLIFNKSNVLLGLFQNKKAIRAAKRCLLVEGNFDILALASQGLRYAAAPMGTALTALHVRALKGYAEEVIILFDGDAAGLKAAGRAVPIFLSQRLTARVVVLPPEHDPDSFVRQFGAPALEKELDKAVSLPEFIFNELEKRYGLSLEGKGRIIEELQPIIRATADDSLQRTLFVSHFSRKLGLLPEQLAGRFSTPRSSPPPPPPEGSPAVEPAAPFKLSRVEEQLLSFLIIYPNYLEPFLMAGLKETVSSPGGRQILEAMASFVESGAAAEPERLLDFVESPARPFISKKIINAPVLEDEELRVEAEEKINWLAENKLRLEMLGLTVQINEAIKNNDNERLMKLLSAKDEMRKKKQQK